MAAANTRIYTVVAEGKPSRLVRAVSPSQAIKHVVGSTITATAASQDDIVELLSHGGKVEDATVEVETETKGDS